MATLSVVIGTRNRLELLKKCLEALIGKIVVDHEIVVVDAGSTDGTLEYVRQLSGVRLVCDGKPIGQAQSLNRVFRTIVSDYVCWISDDNVVQPGALDVATEILAQHPDIGMVALKVKDVTGPTKSMAYMGGISPAGILTCNQGAVRTALLKQVGYFDEALRDYGIDVDLTVKILLAGYKVAYTKMIAIHHYRDHQNAPGAIPNDQRAARSTAAGELYRRKYAHLLPLRFGDRLHWLFRQAAWLGVQAIRKLLGSQTVLGYNMADWLNVFHCRYIQNLDVWHNKDKPFYLVQHIPDTVLRRRNVL
jgi:GT2 family glycosyltransferase